jgi:cell division protein FtsI/penicillin-binding protein 2
VTDKQGKISRDYRQLSKAAKANIWFFILSYWSKWIPFQNQKSSYDSFLVKSALKRASGKSSHSEFKSKAKTDLKGSKSFSKNSTRSSRVNPVFWSKLPSLVFTVLCSLIIVVIWPIRFILQIILKKFNLQLSRLLLVQVVFVLFFGTIAFRLAQLQVLSRGQTVPQTTLKNVAQQIIMARRGQIFIQDLSRSKTDVRVTSSQSLAHVFINPSVLKEQIDKRYITLEEAVSTVSGALNLPYSEIFELFQSEIDRQPILQYVVIPKAKFIDSAQMKAVEYLRNPLPDSNGRYKSFAAWLGIEPVETRSYPEGSLLAATLGFVPKYLETREAALNAGCARMVEENERRGTVNTYLPGDYSKGQYSVGYYGLEQKYCSELGGLNGRKPLNRELSSRSEEEFRAQNGANIFLTIDRNIQLKAEQTLETLVKQNTNSKGGPTDGAILIMEIKTGKILAMASYPTFDPNDPGKADIRAFRNSVTSIDYEVGSVLKPLTVAMALNEYEAGNKDSKGNRLGVPPDWKFDDYDTKGKPYQENNGNIFYIKNAQSLSFGKQLGLSEVLRDSINTGIAEILPTVGNRKTKEYFEEKYLFGKPTLISLPGDAHGNVRPLTANINSDFSYATHGFGQGFTMSPIQLARAFTALGNDGKLVEPYMVDKIVYSNGKVDDGGSPDSLIARPKPVQVFSANVARLVAGYMVNTIDQGYRGIVHSKGQVPGYTIAGKTGTAQVARSYNGQPCNYDCNTALGIYDHTFIGFGPEKNPQVMVLIKLSQPKPGDVNNFAENTLGPGFSDLTRWTFEYLGIPKDR